MQSENTDNMLEHISSKDMATMKEIDNRAILDNCKTSVILHEIDYYTDTVESALSRATSP